MMNRLERTVIYSQFFDCFNFSNVICFTFYFTSMFVHRYLFSVTFNNF